jgi:hypothetical protein
MNTAGPDRPDLDTIVRSTLGGEPPPALERRLRASLRPAWRRAQAIEAAAPVSGWLRVLRPVWSYPVRRTALATLSVAMVVVGAGWNLAHTPDAAASSLALAMDPRLVARAIAGASAMTCTVETRDEDGQRIVALTEWRAGRGSVVRVGAAPPIAIQAGDPAEPETVLSHARGGQHRGAAVSSARPDLRWVDDFLSPARLGRALEGTWTPVDTTGDQAGETYSIARPDGRLVQANICRSSGLPCRLTALPDVAAVCEWATAQPTGLIVGRPASTEDTPAQEGSHRDP